jgi:ATP-dependent RNA helicase HelY
MLAAGKLRAVFATTTLAAGLDVPARTVVLPTLVVRDGFGSRFLSTLEFHQMTGRAGRRGKDKVGFVILDTEYDKDLLMALNLQDAEPEPVKSAFKLSYYQILNLLHRFDIEKTKDILERSLLLYQQTTRRDARGVRTMLTEELRKRIDVLQRFNYLDGSLSLTEFGHWALLIRHENSLVFTEVVRRRLYSSLSPSELAGWVAALTSGRSPKRAHRPMDVKPLLELAREIQRLEKRKGIPALPFSSDEAWRKAATVRLWASGEEWETVVAAGEIEEGDLQWLLLQTAEVLRQLEDLPLPISSTARDARSKILRAPIL